MSVEPAYHEIGRRARDREVPRRAGDGFEPPYSAWWLAGWDARHKELRGGGTMGEVELVGLSAAVDWKARADEWEAKASEWREEAARSHAELERLRYQSIESEALTRRQSAISLLNCFIKPSDGALPNGSSEDAREALVLRIARFLETGSFDDDQAESKVPGQAIAVGAMIPSNKES